MGKVITEGIRAYDKLREKEQSTGAPINRSKGTCEEQEARRRKKKSHSWFSQNQKDGELRYTTTLFVPPTPNSVLAKLLQAAERNNSQGRTWGIKVVEKRGPTILSKVSKSYPWPTSRCAAPECFPCSTAEPQDKPPKVGCRTPGVSYKIICITCKQSGKTSEYQGQTGRTAYSRGLEHKKDLRGSAKSCPMVVHKTAHHPALEPDFKMVILGKFNDPLSRQIEEAERIQASSENPLNMNSRAEWGSTPIPQMGVTQGRVPLGARASFSHPTGCPLPQTQSQAQTIVPVQPAQQVLLLTQRGAAGTQVPPTTAPLPGLPPTTAQPPGPTQVLDIFLQPPLILRGLQQGGSGPPSLPTSLTTQVPGEVHGAVPQHPVPHLPGLGGNEPGRQDLPLGAVTTPGISPASQPQPQPRRCRSRR